MCCSKKAFTSILVIWSITFPLTVVEGVRYTNITVLFFFSFEVLEGFHLFRPQKKKSLNEINMRGRAHSQLMTTEMKGYM